VQCVYSGGGKFFKTNMTACMGSAFHFTILHKRMDVRELKRASTTQGYTRTVGAVMHLANFLRAVQMFVDSRQKSRMSLLFASCCALLYSIIILQGARGSVVGWGTMLQAGRSQVRIPMRSLNYLIDLTLPAALWPSGRLSQPLTEMSTRNISGSKGRPAHKADNLTATCEPIV
jgi:hypothetical protein